MNTRAGVTPIVYILAATCAALVGASAWAQTEGDDVLDDFDLYRIGVSAGEQSAFGASLDGDWALGAKMRWQLGVAYLHADDEPESLNVRQGRAGVERRFGALTVAMESDYRNDNSALETTRVRVRGDWHGDGRGASGGKSVSGGVSLARRRIDVTYDVGPILAQYVDTSQRTYNTEFGARVRFAPNDFALYASGAYYDYDAAVDRLEARLDVSRVPPGQRPALQQLLASIRGQLGNARFRSLRLAGHLLDYSATFGLDYRFGDHLLNVEYLREREALTGSSVDTVEAGWVLPLAAADLEFRFGGSRVQSEDSIVYGGVSLTFFR